MYTAAIKLGEVILDLLLYCDFAEGDELIVRLQNVQDELIERSMAAFDASFEIEEMSDNYGDVEVKVSLITEAQED